MKIEYSKDIDALYIKLREAKVADSKDIEEGVTVDLDKKWHCYIMSDNFKEWVVH